ncbi:MAG: UDP-N-acetylmuramoyl-L-alanyl-D-glutamate--2,6-diaminopimelate ligase, partial [Anaerolineae bacterium]|nr:UDP-N-acetylmuramoyl-L-alanyl-D-glutamate--2,6-diaminopimelate ligase [Anaerolineae bacterium]
MPKQLSELITHLPDVVRVSGDALISAPVVESDAEVQPGCVFVARPGRSVDGHDFIPRVIERGAAVVVGERPLSDLAVPYVQVKNAQEATGFLAAAYHDFPSRKMIVIGVTGTDGKTTTSTLIHSILQVATGGQTGLISTVNAVLGDTVADTGLHVTTPGAPDVQRYLAQMAANGLTHCVLEMTSHGLAQGRLNGVDIDVAVLTNLTHEHLDYHGSFEAYRAAKARMFEMLGQSAYKSGQPKVSVVNRDDANAGHFAAVPADTLLLYGLGAPGRDLPADLAARIQAKTVIAPVGSDVQYLPAETRFNVSGLPGMASASMSTALIGAFNVYNVLAASSATAALGVSIEAIRAGLSHVQGVTGRMERINEGQNFTAIVDFAHTPNALENALKAARTMLPPGKRLIAVFGSAGLRDREKRRMMAEVSARLADFSVFTAEDPRTESLDMILEAMAQGAISQGGVEGQTFIR